MYRVSDYPVSQDLTNNGVRDHPPPMPGVANPPNIPNSNPSRIPTTEDLKRLMSRYLDNPGSRIDTFRVGPSPSGGRLRVMITLDIDI